VALGTDVIVAPGLKRGLQLPNKVWTLPNVSAGVDALEYPVSSGLIADYSLRGRFCAQLCCESEKRFLQGFACRARPGPTASPQSALAGLRPLGAIK